MRFHTGRTCKKFNSFRAFASHLTTFGAYYAIYGRALHCHLAVLFISFLGWKAIWKVGFFGADPFFYSFSAGFSILFMMSRPWCSYTPCPGSWEGYLSLAAPHSWSRSYTLTNLKNRKYSGDWTIYPLIRMIRKKQSEFSEVHWNWVPREANSAAASLADREVGLQCWVDRPPPSLLRVLTADGLPGPPTHLGLSFYFC